MKILVTGGLGSIGYVLVNKLKTIYKNKKMFKNKIFRFLKTSKKFIIRF